MDKNNQQTDVATIVVTETIKTHTLTFLMFAEYMGYVSEFIEDVDNWIDGKVPAPHIQAFLQVEAQDILTAIQKDFSDKDIHTWWEEYYDLILYKADEALSKLKKTTNG